MKYSKTAFSPLYKNTCPSIRWSHTRENAVKYDWYVKEHEAHETILVQVGELIVRMPLMFQRSLTC